jgi:hypothetical protein
MIYSGGDNQWSPLWERSVIYIIPILPTAVAAGFGIYSIRVAGINQRNAAGVFGVVVATVYILIIVGAFIANLYR